MINKVELVKLGQKGITVAEDAVSSYAQSKSNMTMPRVSKRINQAQISVARARRPLADRSAAAVNRDIVANAKSVAISHGTPAEHVQVKSIDYLA